MDYQKHYNLLIERAKNRTLDCYTEKHHINPRCQGGSDDKDNLVDLTSEEHFIAHKLLVCIFPNNPKLIFACRAMCMDKDGNRANNKMVGWLRRKHIKTLSESMMGENNHYFGKSHTEETRKKQSEARKGRFTGKNHSMYGKLRSEEWNQKISETLKGRYAGDKHPMFGRLGKDSPCAKKVNQYTKSGEFVKTWDSIIDAAKELKIQKSNISACCRGIKKSAGGFCWDFNKD